MNIVNEKGKGQVFSETVILGLWQQFPIPMVSRYLAQMGWDCVILDMQHGCFNFETAYECIHSIRTAGAQPWVRTSICSSNEVQKMLDLGAQGIVVPMVNSVKDARELAQAAKYPPLGNRSIGGDFHYTYGSQYPDEANAMTKLLVQVEHIRAVEAVEEIMAVDGVDGCFVGPTDLALSMGLPRIGFESDPRHRSAIQRTVDACAAFKKLACSNCYSLDEAEEKVRQGYQCITLKSDADHFMTTIRKLLVDLHERTEKQAGRTPTGSTAAASNFHVESKTR